MILLPETNLEGAKKMAEKLRREIAGYDSPVIKSLTACFGVAEFQHSEEEKDFVSRVDMALYKAKNAGRNRVEAAD